MTSNKPQREQIWKIGSFTKNFSWGNAGSGLHRLHTAINVGFNEELRPTPRRLFWERLEKRGFIPHIPSNFFVFNSMINGESYVFPDEMVFQALSLPHRRSFDKIAFFTLILSEVGKWKGAQAGQSQPSEWARYFAIEKLRNIEYWRARDYSPDEIERFLEGKNNFRGGNGTRKLATNLSYFFNLAKIEDFPQEENLSWIADAIFLALDRYFMIGRPEKISIEWAIDILSQNDVANLSGPFHEIVIQLENSVARLYVEGQGIDRLNENTNESVIGIISREPLIYKILPEIVGKWLSARLFVEFVDESAVPTLGKFDSKEFYEKAIAKLHNSVPKPELSGDQLLALVRPDNDSD